MRFLKTYESFGKFEKGDIVVSLNDAFYGDARTWNNYIKKNDKYKVINISPRGKLKIKEHPYGKTLSKYFPNDLFMKLEDWEMMQDMNKYNL